MKAVILAGGMGERLKPLTNVIPKALASIQGKPIIQHQIEILTKLGVLEFVILTGYRSEMIRNYLTSVNKNSLISIHVAETPQTFSPAQRLIAAKELIGEDFLLIYCDNLINDEKALMKIISSSKPITFLAEKRLIGNSVVFPRYRYFLERSQASPYVELGFIHIQTEAFFRELNSTNSLQETLATASLELDCGVEITNDSLSSVSDISRFNSLRRGRRTLLLDRDGILNKKMPHRTYLNNFKDYIPLQDNLNDLHSLYSKETDFIIITNQPGLATGHVGKTFLDDLHSRMITSMLVMGISIIGLYVCGHHWDENCPCRKPKPGMILQAIKDYQLVPDKIAYVGDEQKDLDAARSAGITGICLTETPYLGQFKDFKEAFDSIQKIISM